MLQWKQISLEVKKTEIDLVSEVLVGLGSISISYSSADDDTIYSPPIGQTPLWDWIKVTALFSSEINQQFIEASILEFCNIVVVETLDLKDRIWEKECQKDFSSMQFGKNLWVCPSWELKNSIPSDAIVINMDPGLAFGTGTHQTTSICLDFLDETPPKSLDVIDFGCGTGILAIASAKLGAKRVLAIDNDPQAVIASKENAAQNNCADIIKTFHSAEKFKYEKCDLLMANILAKPLVELQTLFSEIIKPSGAIFLSGILEDQVEIILDCYSNNFNNFIIKNKNEWYGINASRNN